MPNNVISKIQLPNGNTYDIKDSEAKRIQTAINDPTASGTAVEFIDSISQNTEGVITPTKKTVATVTTSANGLMSSTDKTKLNGIEAGAQVNSVTGIKGNEESTYRTGNINLTSANIGAKTVQTAVTDPIAEGTSIEFINSISQNAQGVIAPTKKTVASATTSTAGLMSAEDKTKLDNAKSYEIIGPENMVSVSDAIEAKAGKILVNIEPVQAGSGDPSPTNVRPISGWTGAKVTRCGKNLFNIQNVNSFFTVDGDVISKPASLYNMDLFTGTGGAAAVVPLDKIHLLPRLKAGTYNLSTQFITGSSIIHVRQVNDDGSLGFNIDIYNDTASFTLPSETYVTIRIDTNQSVVFSNLQIEPGSTATAYEPYAGDTYDITFPSEAGMVYGGMLNVTTGMLTVDRAMVDLGTLTWSHRAEVASGLFFCSAFTSYRHSASVNALCSSYAYKGTVGSVVQVPKKGDKVTCIYYSPELPTNSSLYVYDTTYTDVTTFKSAMSGVQLVYELATPQTYQLTPTEVALLLGENNVWADTGDITVGYLREDSLGTGGAIADIKNALTETNNTINNLTPASIGAKATQTAVSSPITNGNAIAFIDSISQDTQGIITPTKKEIPIANNLTETTTGKVLDATQGKVLNDSKLDKDFNFTAATLPYSNLEKIALRGTDGNNYYTTIGELASQMGGSGGGTSQTALVHYVKNCGTISTLPWENPTIDNNITENMVVLKAELSNPTAQTSDWTCTTTNGYVTISGTISGSTNVLLYFGISLSTAPSIIVNLSSNNSDNVLKTNPTPGVMGILGTANGGTGVSATDAADLRSKLGILCYRTTVTIPIDSNTGEATISGLDHADEYVWCANLIATSASTAYSNCFIEYTIVQSGSIRISVNRKIRNDTSTAITFNIDVIGVHI